MGALRGIDPEASPYALRPHHRFGEAHLRPQGPGPLQVEGRGPVGVYDPVQGAEGGEGQALLAEGDEALRLLQGKPAHGDPQGRLRP